MVQGAHTILYGMHVTRCARCARCMCRALLHVMLCVHVQHIFGCTHDALYVMCSAMCDRTSAWDGVSRGCVEYGMVRHVCDRRHDVGRGEGVAHGMARWVIRILHFIGIAHLTWLYGL